jgi:hypothetical protein
MAATSGEMTAGVHSSWRAVVSSLGGNAVKRPPEYPAQPLFVAVHESAVGPEHRKTMSAQTSAEVLLKCRGFRQAFFRIFSDSAFALVSLVVAV